ncbi:MAG: TIGR01777 family oxidoreductase [Phycisphaerae bacterium]
MPHEPRRTDPPMRVTISGASGLVGGPLASFLAAGGHRVDPLVRREPQPGSTEIRWDPGAGNLDPAALEGVDAAVNLSGETIAGTWTAARKAAIRDSRVDSTRLLVRAMCALKRKPRVLISASAVGYYGDRGEAELSEDSSAGRDFLADVAQQWEAETRPAADAGVRVVNLRIGVVLSPRGGALAQLLAPFRAGLGGVVGDGRQYMSWIALDDLVGLIQFAIFNDALRGPLNATAPNPVTNHEFTKALGRVLHRPTVVPLPAFAVKLMFGEMGETLLLAGQRVLPARALAAGFQFFHPELEDALRFELGMISA